MASRPIPSWFDNLPSWIQSGRNSYHDDQGSRVSSLVSASTRTKTKSRAEAMRKLEGRKLSEPTTMASTRGEDSESEDDDPWTDPWQWQRPPGARRSSSVYSEAQELQTMHKYFDEQIQNPFVEEDHAGPGAAGHVKKPFVEDCRERTKPGSQNYTKNPFTEEDNSSSEEFTSAEAKQQDLGFQVRNALRQSYTTDLTHPPKAYSVLSRRFSLTPSDSPYRLSWLHSCPDDEYAKAHGLWRGASRSFDPDLRSERSAKEAEAARYLGWRFETVEAPKSVYQSSVESKLSSCPSRSVSERRILKDCLAREGSIQLSWLHFMAAFLVFFNTWGVVCAFGAFRSFYERVSLPETNQSSLAWIGSTQLAMLFFAMAPSGQLVARGYFRSVFLTGTTLLVIGIFSAGWCSTATTIWLTQGLITGVGTGLAFGSSSALAMQQYRELPSRLRFSILGAPIGGLCYALLARKLDANYGPRTTLPIVALVIALAMILPLVVLSRSTPRFSSLSNDSRGTEKNDNWKHQYSSASTLHLGLVASGLFCAALGAYFGLFYLGSGGLLPLQVSMSPMLLIAALIASIPGCLLLTVLGQHVAFLQCLAGIALLDSCVMWLWLALAQEVETSMVVACLYGLLAPGIPMLCIPAIYSLCFEPATKLDRELQKAKSSDAAWAFRPYGRRACVLSICMGVACLVGTPLCAALLDSAIQRESLQRPYLAAQAFAGSALSVGGILLLGAAITEGTRGSRIQTKEYSQAEG